ncbi:hypothetical protein [Haloplanus sp.]|uniref:hypothetical protein n=1 Tax=Haloplanus sp. TaxID=1961696 RepID=UPI00261D7C56|nr:hypothetical protein [Haloplanus sp.]
MSADPVPISRLESALPSPPGAWERHDDGSVVQYRLPGDNGICIDAKLTVCPDLVGPAAVRINRVSGCQSAGTTRHDELGGAVDAVEAELTDAPATTE